MSVFDPFFTTKAAGEGTGLGLSLVCEIVEGHGGQIWVESREGAGSNFSIVVPRDAAKANAALKARREATRRQQAVKKIDEA